MAPVVKLVDWPGQAVKPGLAGLPSRRGRLGEGDHAVDTRQLVERLRMAAPSCLKDFKIAPAQLPEPVDSHPCAVWQIACRCGSAIGQFLGHPLKDYNAEYDGPECFLSPLAFACSDCKAVTELLDTDRHGYHPEVARRDGKQGGSAKLRGAGARRTFACPGCGGDQFLVTVGFVFWHPDELAEEFDDAWEELFSVFLCHCQCARCGQISQPTDFGKL